MHRRHQSQHLSQTKVLKISDIMLTFTVDKERKILASLLKLMFIYNGLKDECAKVLNISAIIQQSFSGFLLGFDIHHFRQIWHKNVQINIKTFIIQTL